jgi:hypothetical protein
MPKIEYRINSDWTTPEVATFKFWREEKAQDENNINSVEKRSISFSVSNIHPTLSLPPLSLPLSLPPLSPL